MSIATVMYHYKFIMHAKLRVTTSKINEDVMMMMVVIKIFQSHRWVSHVVDEELYVELQ